MAPLARTANAPVSQHRGTTRWRQQRQRTPRLALPLKTAAAAACIVSTDSSLTRSSPSFPSLRSSAHRCPICFAPPSGESAASLVSNPLICSTAFGTAAFHRGRTPGDSIRRTAPAETLGSAGCCASDARRRLCAARCTGGGGSGGPLFRASPNPWSGRASALRSSFATVAVAAVAASKTVASFCARRSARNVAVARAAMATALAAAVITVYGMVQRRFRRTRCETHGLNRKMTALSEDALSPARQGSSSDGYGRAASLVSVPEWASTAHSSPSIKKSRASFEAPISTGMETGERLQLSDVFKADKSKPDVTQEGTIQIVPAGAASQAVEPTASSMEGDEGNTPLPPQTGGQAKSFPEIGCDGALDSNEMSVPTRFVRAAGGSFEAGRRRYRATLAWRRKHGIDGLLSEPQPLYRLIKRHYPHYHHLRGLGGEPVYYEFPPRTDLAALRSAGLALGDMLRYYALVCEFTWRCICRDDEDARSIYVMDLRGLRIQDFAGEAADFVRRASAFTRDHYPERLGVLFVLNVPPWFHVVWRVVRTFANEPTRRKIRILAEGDGDEAVRAALEERIAWKNIPPEYGGGSMPLGESPEETLFEELMERNNSPLMKGGGDGNRDIDTRAQ